MAKKLQWFPLAGTEAPSREKPWVPHMAYPYGAKLVTVKRVPASAGDPEWKGLFEFSATELPSRSRSFRVFEVVDVEGWPPELPEGAVFCMVVPANQHADSVGFLDTDRPNPVMVVYEVPWDSKWMHPEDLQAMRVERGNRVQAARWKFRN